MAIKIIKSDNKIFAPILNEWLKFSPEEELKQAFIKRLIDQYGYKLEQLGQDIFIRDRYKADIVIWKSAAEKKQNKIPSIIIAAECKAEHIKIKEDDYLIGYNFASTVKANFFIATNLKETKVFHIKNEVSHKKLERLKEIPSAALISDTKKISKFIDQAKTFTRDEFTRLLSKCHNIIRNNDKLSPESAFDEISKVLFMKIMYERNKEMVFSKDRFKAEESDFEQNIRPTLKESGSIFFDKEYMQYLFDKTKKAYENDDLFELTDTIKIKSRSFEMIVEELEAFNLSDTSDDVKGIAFEEFLGKTFRGELGQFFTPRTIVDYMVEVLDPQENELVCDPCCGSGGFLIKTFDYIRDKIEKDIDQNIKSIEKKLLGGNFNNLPEKQKLKIEQQLNAHKENIRKEYDLQNKFGRLYKLSHDCIFGIDANPRMARTAKMNMIMHGDGHGGVHHHDGLLNINGIFDGRFDVILTNPPFGSRVNKSLKVTTADIPSEEKIKYYESKYDNYRNQVVNQLEEWAAFDNGSGKSMGKSLLDIFSVGSWSSLTEVLFMERCLNLLKPGGRMGIVLPEGVLNNSALQKIRDYVEGKAKIINITSIPQEVFIASGATVKPSLLFLKKFTVEEERKFKKLVEETSIEIANKNKEKLNQLKKELEKKELALKNKKDNDKSNELKKKYNEEKKLIQDLTSVEISNQIKEKFNYLIPIIEVEKAGISSTGAACENELIEVSKEFSDYRKETNLWNSTTDKIVYEIDDLNRLNRFKYINDVKEDNSEVFLN